MEFLPLHALQDLFRAQRVNLESQAWDQAPAFRGQQRDAVHGGWNRADRQMAARHAAHHLGLLPQPFEGGKNLTRPGENSFPLGRDPLEAAIALDDGDAEFALQLADAGGQRRLRDMAALGRPREMPVLVEGDEIGELPHEHIRGNPRCTRQPMLRSLPLRHIGYDATATAKSSSTPAKTALEKPISAALGPLQTRCRQQDHRQDHACQGDGADPGPAGDVQAIVLTNDPNAPPPKTATM